MTDSDTMTVIGWIVSAAVTAGVGTLVTLAKMAYSAALGPEGIANRWLKDQLELTAKLKTVPDTVRDGFDRQHQEDSQQTELLRSIVEYQTAPAGIPNRVVRKTDLEIDAGISVCDSVEAFWDGDDKAARAKLHEARELLRQAKEV